MTRGAASPSEAARPRRPDGGETRARDSHRRSRRRLLRSGFGAAAFLVCAGVRTPARAHAFHVALAEVEWNPATRALELGVRLDANDLERRLSLATGRSIVLDRAPDAAVLVRDLLRHTLTIRPRGGAPLPLRWVGMEVGLHHAWAFAEVPSPAGPGGLEVRMATLHDLEPTQLNTVNAIADGDARSVTFARGDGFKPLRWPD